MLTRIHHVSVLVADVDASLAFYCGVLGLTIDTSRPQLGYDGAWLSTGDRQQIHLLCLENPDPISGRPAHGGRDRHIAFETNDYQTVVDQLEDAGITYTLSRSGRRALFCRDPDGNALEIIEQTKAG